MRVLRTMGPESGWVALRSGLQPEAVFHRRFKPEAESHALAFERFPQPGGVFVRSGVEPELSDLQDNELEAFDGARLRFDIGEVHQREVVAELLMSADALIVVQEIPTAIEDQPTAIDFDRLGMMRGMAVDDGNIRAIDERMGDCPVLRQNFVSQFGPQWIDTTTMSPGCRMRSISPASRSTTASDNPGRKFTPGRPGFAAHAAGVPLESSAQEKMTPRA